MKFTNQLSEAETERLALLAEELAEAIHIIGKILRHGYESYNPDLGPPTNRELLEKELGDVRMAVDLMQQHNDVRQEEVLIHSGAKWLSVGRYLHHQHPESHR